MLLAAPSAREAAAQADRRERRPPPSHAAMSLFTHSDDCVACHNGLTTPSGEDVSIGSTWRSTMMANSARDPYWQAGVRRETIDHPRHAAAIQDECAACHMPMSTRIERADGGTGRVFDHLPLATRHPSALHRLASDGISCSVCHQIAPDRLGTRESFNSNFVVAPTPAGGARRIFGPYAIDPGRQRIMQSVTGFVQAEAPHMKQSELCASCHTLITQAYGPDGDVIGSLPEQMNFQEWLHSDFPREQRSCQSCHMPKADGPIRASSVLGDARDSLARHVFVGGNAFMVRMLNRYRTELAVEALPSELEATASATIRQLQEDTARVVGFRPARDGRCAGVRRAGPQPDRAQVPDRLSLAPDLAARHRTRRRAAASSSNRAPSTRRAPSAATTATPTPSPSSRITRRSRAPARCRSTSPCSAIASARRPPACSPRCAT